MLQYQGMGSLEGVTFPELNLSYELTRTSTLLSANVIAACLAGTFMEQLESWCLPDNQYHI